MSEYVAYNEIVYFYPQTWLDFDERLFYSSPLEDTGVCKYSFSHILHVVHSEQEGEPEVDDNAFNDQGDAYDEVLVQGINCIHNEAYNLTAFDTFFWVNMCRLSLSAGIIIHCQPKIWQCCISN